MNALAFIAVQTELRNQTLPELCQALRDASPDGGANTTVGGQPGRSSLVGTFSALPCSMHSLMVVLYLENPSWSLRGRFLSSAARHSTMNSMAMVPGNAHRPV